MMRARLSSEDGTVIGSAGVPPHFHPPRPDHAPAELLSDEELARVIATLRRKVHSVRRARLAANVAGAALTVAVLTAGFVLLWAGPAPFLERLTGQRTLATPWHLVLWWLGVLLLAAVGGALGDQILRRRLRVVRGWSHKLHELERRLAEAESVRHRRGAER
jgi:hypothetical protein